MRLLAVALLLGFAPLTAHADDALNPPHPALARIQANLDHCTDTQPGNINEMLCAVEAYKAVDVLLNTLYGKIVAKLKQNEDPDHDLQERKELLKRLVASERAWIAYSETECSHASAYMLGGSGEPTILAQCRLSMREDRLNNLFRFYKIRYPDIAEE
ncbi:lysozyme inhibitor LprI family protein [Bradyrhizobium ganzhouense]|uniref:lysozyme inhibitor LprI family protein n=1 Tax=Bradyrhizobium ganzhouense TaxID=1179767 RepID=UPI003CEA86E2